MSDKELRACPSLEQYKNQAKDLARDCALRNPDALARIRRHHPRFYKLSESDLQQTRVSRTDAQLVLAREHGFESWPKFAHHIETVRLIESLDTLPDPVSAFIEMASVPLHIWHVAGTLDHAELVLSRYPHVATANIYTAAILADEAAVRSFLAHDPSSATTKGGAYDWDPLTYLCFSRYLRFDKSRSDAFARTARALLEAGASANTGFYEIIDYPNPRPAFETVIYAAGGLAQNPELTRLLLEYGADPNDEETPYHVPETYDNSVLEILLGSGRFNERSLATVLARKADWHDEKGLALALAHGANPNFMTAWKRSPFQHAIRRDNSVAAIEQLLDHGADPSIVSPSEGRSAASLAARRGRGDILIEFEARGLALNLEGVDRLIALCAKGELAAAQSLSAAEPDLALQLTADGGSLLSEFAGNNNVEGLRCLLDIGVPIGALYDGDPYFGLVKNSTALHVASWRAMHGAVKFLIDRGADVNSIDAKGRSPLALAVKATVDSYWKNQRTPESIEALLHAGADIAGIETPTGYDEADALLRQHSG